MTAQRKPELHEVESTPLSKAARELMEKTRGRTYRHIPLETAPRDPNMPKRLVLSEKAQLYLEFMGLDAEYLERFAAARDMYFRARTTDNINRITQVELEQIMGQNALTLATRRGVT